MAKDYWIGRVLQEHAMPPASRERENRSFGTGISSMPQHAEARNDDTGEWNCAACDVGNPRLTKVLGVFGPGEQ
jgi:hypothetical protein